AYPDESWTWEDELVEASKKLLRRDSQGVVTRYGIESNPRRPRGSWGANLLTEDNTQSNVLSDEHVAYFNFMQQLGELDLFVRDDGWEDFTSSRSAMVVSGYWMQEPFNASDVAGRYSVAPIPAGPDGRIVEWVIGAYAVPTSST